MEAELLTVDAAVVIAEAKRRLEERVTSGDSESAQHLASLEKTNEVELDNEIAALLSDVLDQIDQSGHWRLLGDQPSESDANDRWEDLTPVSDSDRLVMGYINHLLMWSSSGIRWQLSQRKKASKVADEASQDDWLRAA